jgi:hypothetical protein
MFHKTGRNLQGAARTKQYAHTVADALREELGQSHRAIKTLARWTGASERTAKNWLSATNGPSGNHLIQLARRSDIVLAAVLALAGRHELLIGLRLVEIRAGLESALKHIEGMMASPSQTA